MVGSPLLLAFSSSFESDPKTRKVPSADRLRPTYPAAIAAVWGIEPFMPWTSEPSGRRTGIPVEPSAKHGEQISGPPKAKVPRPSSASASVEENRLVEKPPSAGMPTYFVVHPSGPR